MPTRRSRPPRNRKSRSTEPPRRDVVVTTPPPGTPVEELDRSTSSAEAPEDELEALDAGWDS